VRLNLEGKAVAITGGSNGIGKAAAIEFAREKCRVAVCGRNSGRLEKIRKDIENLGVEAYIESVDVTKLDELQLFSDNVNRKFGGIDIWVNNVGATFRKLILDCTETDWDYSCDLNLKSVFFGSQFAMKHMINSNIKGVIVNISTYAIILPAKRASIYAATKSGILNITRSFAAECAPYGIRVVAVAPGTTQTEMMDKALTEADKKKLVSEIAARRFGSPEEIARPIVFLASDAASYVNGVSLEVSGGKYCIQSLQLEG
jgi:NAD(P)-dependent dehydrogenase (short-subunit alcohol dehydrogenase family)